MDHNSYFADFGAVTQNWGSCCWNFAAATFVGDSNFLTCGLNYIEDFELSVELVCPELDIYEDDEAALARIDLEKKYGFSAF